MISVNMPQITIYGTGFGFFVNMQVLGALLASYFPSKLLRIIGRYGEPHAFVGEPLSPLTDAPRENRHPALEEKREHKVKTKVVRRRLGQPLIKSGDVKAGV